MASKSKLEKKQPRNHPALEDVGMIADGFRELNELAFNPLVEKSAAPLSKRRNGVGPTHHNGGLGNVYQTVAYYKQYALLALGIYALYRWSE